MIGIKYTSAWCNPSGYGSAARAFINALYIAGINLTLETVSQMGESTNYGTAGSICKSLENRDIDYKIKIIHLTPDLYPIYIEKDKYNIGHLFFETNKLPEPWIKSCNMMDEIWTASEQQASMIRNSGVTVPIYSFPQPIDINLENLPPLKTQYEKDFYFLSIFQWITRKNPEGLLKAYWKEFTGNDNVTLVLKTYRVTYSEQEYELIKQEIEQWRKELNLKHYPKIYLVNNLLTEKQIIQLIKMSDCYVSASSGEGWARGTQEAMLYGNPVISGDNGGITDYITDYFKVESKSVRATTQSFIPWYTSEMFWKELDEDSLRKQMRAVFSDFPSAKQVAVKSQEAVCEMSLDKVGKMMLNRLNEALR